VIYVKTAVEFLNSKGFAVQLGTERLVTFITLGTNSNIPEDTQEIFTKGTAPEGSGIFVISAEINNSDFTLNNFCFHYEATSILPPIPKINMLNEFRAAMILSKQSNICLGMDQSRINPKHLSKSARKSLTSCNIVAYPHRGNLCVHCKMLRSKAHNTHSTPPQNDLLNEVLEECLRYISYY